MTRHQNLNSLDVYIDLTFNEIFNTKVVLDKVANLLTKNYLTIHFLNILYPYN